MDDELTRRIRRAWQGRVSGCMLGKPVELLSMLDGHEALVKYLETHSALPLRDYIPHDVGNERVDQFADCCRGRMNRSVPDDDINYSVLALMMLEEHGAGLTTADVARTWLNYLPAAATFTAERAAYITLLNRGHDWFASGHEPGFDLSACSDNPYNDWIGAQIRADVYGWVCPGEPDLAAKLVTADAGLSHRDDGVHGAVFVAVMGALVPGSRNLAAAADSALAWLPADSGAAAAVKLAQSVAGDLDGHRRIRDEFNDLSPVHTLNNLALVVWALLTWPDNFSAAIGEVVAAGWDTDCNGATVGGLWALQDQPVPEPWTRPWQGKVGLGLAGQAEISLDELVARTWAVAVQLSGSEGG